MKLKSGFAVALRAMALTAALAAGCGDDGESEGQALDPVLRGLMDAANIQPLDPGPEPAPAEVALGRALMFDRELSGNRDISCATCHHPLLRTGDALSLSIGTGGSGLGPERRLGGGRGFIPRNAPEVFNRGLAQWRSMFWDMRLSGSIEEGLRSPAGERLPSGLASILAAQAMFPVTSRDEMRGRPGDRDVDGQPNELAMIDDQDLTAIWSALMRRLLTIPEYVELFNSAFPDVATEELGFQHAANAIAAFETASFTFLGSPWDRYVAGDESALSEDSKRGAILFFGAGGCSRCHAGGLLTDQEAHNVAVPQVGPGKGAEAPQDFGRGRVTGNDTDRYAFRTPPLRNVALTGPWMHDGAFTTLRGAVRHMLDPAASLRGYDPGQLAPELRETFQGDEATMEAILANLDPRVAAPRRLSEAEVDDLLAFLNALTDPAALDLGRNIPDSVPSGLPVED